MEIKGPNGNIPLVSTPGGEASSNQKPVPSSTRLLAQAWQLGQYLSAIVVKTQQDHVTLNINGTLIEGKIPIPLRNGQALQLQVLNTKPALELKIVQQPPRMEQDTRLSALRIAMPKQMPMGPLLANLQQLNQVSAKLVNHLPPQVLKLSQSLYQQLPTQKEVTNADGLKQAISQSGLFLENALARIQLGQAQEKRELQTNVRTQLLRLAAILRATALPSLSDPQKPNPLSAEPKPEQIKGFKPNLVGNKLSDTQADLKKTLPQIPKPQAKANPNISQNTSPKETIEILLRQVEGVLARLQVQQLQSTTTNEAMQSTLVTELPVRNEESSDIFHLRIERDGEQNHEQAKPAPWIVTLAFDLEHLGPVHVQIVLINKNLAVTFWAELAMTEQLFNEHMNTLYQRLDQAGIQVGRLDCCRGKPRDSHLDKEFSLLDEKA